MAIEDRDPRHTGKLDATQTEAISGWLESRDGKVSRPIVSNLIVGGRSNYTYHLVDARDRSWILRHPPSVAMASAHDMSREFSALRALQSSPVPVPRPIGLENTSTLIGVPFYVMEYVPGVVLRDLDTAKHSMTRRRRKSAATAMVSTLAALHDIDFASVGLEDFQRSEPYVQRQLGRWKRQIRQASIRDLPGFLETHAILSESVPKQTESVIVHGDYRLDNMIFRPTGQLNAIVDWELWSIGDPLADLAILAVYWSDPEDEILPLGDVASLAEGFPRRGEIIDTYATAAGRDVSHFEFYFAFAYWRLAAILEGIFGRVQGGLYKGTEIPGSHDLEQRVPEMLRFALHLARQIQ